MGNFIIGNEELKKIQKQKSNIPIIYSKGDITKYWQDNFKYGKALDDQQLNTITSWLNEVGHTQDNLQNVLETIYYGPYNPPVEYTPKSPWERLKEGALKTVKFVGNSMDIPRKAVASFVNKDAKEEAYNPAYILDVMGTLNNDPTPVMGYEFARNNPLTSAAVDIITPIALGSIGGGIKNIAANAYNYATRKAVPSYSKNAVLQSIRNGTAPQNVGYEITESLVPTTRGAKYTQVITGGPKKGTVVTRTGTQGTNGARHRPMVKNHSLKVEQVHGYNSPMPGYKMQTNVTAWPIVPFSAPIIPGLPQHVVRPIPITPITPQPEHTIVETIPMDLTDSEIINWAIQNWGLQEGDTIRMPDGRSIKYEVGPVTRDSSSLGRVFSFGVENEYDRHDREPKQQPNVPSMTKLIGGKTKASVKVRDGKNPSTYSRDSSNYFPYIVPLSQK